MAANTPDRCRVYVVAGQPVVSGKRQWVSQRCDGVAAATYNVPTGAYHVCTPHLRALEAGHSLRLACDVCSQLEEACTCARNRFAALPPVVGGQAEFNARQQEARATGVFTEVCVYCDSCNAPGPVLERLTRDPAGAGWFLGVPMAALEPLDDEVLLELGEAGFNESAAFRFVEGAHFLALCPTCLAVYDDLLLERGLTKFSLVRAP